MVNLWANLWSTSGWTPGWRFYLSLWFGLGITTDFFFGLIASRQLLRDFRQLAMHRFAPRQPRFAQWFARRNAAMAESRSQPLNLAETEARPIPGSFRRKRAVIAGGVVVLLIACGIYGFRKSNPHFPPPVIVSLTENNAPLRVFSGISVLMVLPDGSLWRWGQTGGGQSSRVVVL